MDCGESSICIGVYEEVQCGGWEGETLGKLVGAAPFGTDGVRGCFFAAEFLKGKCDYESWVRRVVIVF